MRDLHQWLAEVGYPDLTIQFTGKPERFATGGGRNKNGWYVAFQNHCGDKTFHYVQLGDWSTGESHEFKSWKDGEVSPAESKIIQEEIRKAKESERKEREKIQEDAAREAEAVWVGASPTGSHPYLEKKGLSSLYGARTVGSGTDESHIIVPCRIGEKIWGLQRIYADGKKRFLTGQKKKGTHFALAGRIPDRPHQIIIAEGYATACSIYSAIIGEISHGVQLRDGGNESQGDGVAVVVAFDAGNLLPVATELRKRYPETEIVFAADNDAYGKENVGVEKACAAAEHLGHARVFWPDFQRFHEECAAGTRAADAKPTDWNDLHCLYGLDEVRRQFDLLPGALFCKPVPFQSPARKDLGDGPKVVIEGELVPPNQIAPIEPKSNPARLIPLYQWAMDPFVLQYHGRMSFRYLIKDIQKKEVELCDNTKFFKRLVAEKVSELWGQALTDAQLDHFISVWDLHGKKIDSEPVPFAWGNEDKWCYKKLDFIPTEGIYPSWAEFLMRLSNADEFMAFVWSIFEMKNESRQFLYLYDPVGEGGKSKVIQVLGEIFGGAFTALTNSMVSGAANRWLIGSLYGRRLVAWADCKNPKFCMSEIVRNITSGDNVQVEFKGRQPFAHPMYLKLIIGSNHEPEISSAGADISRLLRIDVAENRVNKNDPEWPARLRLELPQFLFACREAYGRLCKGHGKIELSTETKDRVGESTDSVEAKWEEIAHRRLSFGEDLKTNPHDWIRMCYEEKLDNNQIGHFKDYLRRRYNVARKRESSGAREWWYRGMKVMVDRMPQQSRFPD